MATIKLKRGTSTPTTSNIVNGEVALDLSAKKLYVNDGGTIKEIGANTNLTASQLNDINVVAGQVAHGTDLGSIADTLSTASGASNIQTVANNIANVNAVGGKATELGRLGTADAVADMNTLGTTAIVSDMDTLADIASNITTVAGVASNVTSVAGNATNVNTVAGSIANVNTAGTNIAKITTVADDLNEATSEIDTVATNITNVNNVGNNISNVNTVAGVSSNVTTVAGISSNVTSVAGVASNVTTVASNLTNVNNFAATYQIASSAPSTDGAGNALAEGDLYFDTSSDELKVYNGSAWQGGVTAGGNFATLGSNQFSGNITFTGNQTVDGRDVSADGSDLDTLKSGNFGSANITTSGTIPAAQLTGTLPAIDGSNLTGIGLLGHFVCHLKSNTTASVTSTATVVNFNQESSTNTSKFSHSNGAITVLETGWYTIKGSLVYKSAATSRRNTIKTALTKNGTNVPTTEQYTYIQPQIEPIIIGHVNSDGTKIKGEGFTVTRNSVGEYTITFSSAMPDANYIVNGQIQEGSNRDDIKIHVRDGDQTTSSFKVYIYEGDNGTSADVLRDRDFYFTVNDIKSAWGRYGSATVDTTLYLAANDVLRVTSNNVDESGSTEIVGASSEFIVSGLQRSANTSNADTVDGLHASQFLRSDTDNSTLNLDFGTL